MDQQAIAQEILGATVDTLKEMGLSVPARTYVYEDDRDDWDDAYMGSDSDFSDHALGIDY
jgi:1,2-phenylacetyl-CoA epoxidase catalytic subunit